jgi:hypothetical protein
MTQISNGRRSSLRNDEQHWGKWLVADGDQEQWRAKIYECTSANPRAIARTENPPLVFDSPVPSDRAQVSALAGAKKLLALVFALSPHHAKAPIK